MEIWPRASKLYIIDQETQGTQKTAIMLGLLGLRTDRLWLMLTMWFC